MDTILKNPQWNFDAIGTRWQVDLVLPEGLKEENIKPKVFSLIEDFDKCYSRFREDSLVFKIFRHPGEYVLPQNARMLMDLYQKFYRISDGIFTPLIGQTLRQAGYDENYSLVPQSNIQKPPAWEEALIYEFPKLVTTQPVLLDFGAAGKGYLVDLVGGLLKSFGLSEYTIDAGGDILHESKQGRAVRVGLEDPDDFSRAIGVMELSCGSICGSAGNRRRWDKYHHIINPRNLFSPGNIAAVWVWAQSAMVADALATALFFCKASQFPDYKFEYALIHKDRRAEISAGFKAEIFTL